VSVPGQQKTVLIVDDIEDNRVLLERALRSSGYLTVSLDSGKAALAYMSNNTPDIVLLDWMMPGLSGYDTLRAIRENYGPSRLPVIMCTALGEEEHVVEAIEAGANDYVLKPISLPILRARMAAQLSQTAMVHSLDDEKCEAKRKLAEQTRLILRERSAP
jgi:DNA-binding response OmpR family regulator